MLPRIPCAEIFWAFSKAGRDLEDVLKAVENVKKLTQ